MTMKLFDLSVYTEENPLAEPFPVSIVPHKHTESAETMARRRGLEPSAFNDGMALTHEDFSGQFHCGTHVDAPFHFGPLCAGKPARTIDELPLDWFFQDGVRLDLRSVPHNALITVEDIKGALSAIGYTLKPMDIVLLWTDFDKLIYSPEYLKEQPGMSREATEYILEGKIKELFPGHMVGRDREYVHMEKLGQLDALPTPTGFKVACFPTKGRGCTAGMSRIVALYA